LSLLSALFKARAAPQPPRIPLTLPVLRKDYTAADVYVVPRVRDENSGAVLHLDRVAEAYTRAVLYGEAGRGKTSALYFFATGATGEQGAPTGIAGGQRAANGNAAGASLTPSRQGQVHIGLGPQPLWGAPLHGSRNETNWVRRMATVAASGLIFAGPVLLVSLPFLLYSGDYLYMNLQYVAGVPLQTQSWLVAVAGIFGPDFFLLQHSTLFVALAACIISFLAARRGFSLWLTGMLIALAFFLLSQKVMGYYYVMLLPFALVELIPARRWNMLLLVIVATSWISLSPYLASWANPGHLPVYAALGTLNSGLWLALFIYLWRNPPLAIRRDNNPPFPPFIKGGNKAVTPLLYKEGIGEGVSERALLFVSAALFSEAVSAALVQPLVDNPTSPIRAPIVPPGLEANALLAFIVFMLLVLAAAYTAVVLTRGRSQAPALPRPMFALALVFAPLFFLTLTLTKESTAFLEILLKSLGL
jgi:hypothetical protein